MTKRFYKDEGGWFIDLPEYIEAGIGTKGNLAMVCGADTMLDKLSNNGDEIIIKFEDHKFKGWEDQLTNIGIGMDKEALDAVEHPEVEYGGYYHAKKLDHNLWLCPVVEFIWGHYPKEIYIRIVDKSQ